MHCDKVYKIFESFTTVFTFFKTSAEVLMAEAGMQLIHPTAFNFKKLVLNGEWSQAVKSTCKFNSANVFLVMVRHDSLYAEQILNKIANTFDGTYAGLKSMLQRFRIYFA